MVDRPPVRLLSRLPEGNANGLDLEVARLVDRDGPAEPEGYALIRYVSPKIDVNRETGVDTAVIRIVEIEPLVAGRMPTAYDHAGEALQAIRGDRTGTQRIPEDDPAGYARLVELRRQLEAYRVREDITVTTLGAKVIDTIPGAEAGWRDDPRIIDEFLRHVDELDEDALDHAGELGEPVENQSLERAGEDGPDDDVPAETDDPGRGGAPVRGLSSVPAATFTGAGQ
jgi:hypothetical protein